MRVSAQNPLALGAQADEGAALLERARDLFPLNRSITGEGLRETLRRLGEGLPLAIHELATGTRVLDWCVPEEWNVREAWVERPDGERVIDFADSNLHLVGYSEPVDRRMPLAELQEHLHSLPEHPEWIPWRTSLYRRDWGFCLPHCRRETLPDGEYHVRIDSSLRAGSLSYGEILLRGRREEEVLFSAHCCHPSLANDNLSGLVVLRRLAELLSGAERRFSYRFVFAPGTIGAITWIARNEDALSRIRLGLVVAGVGDRGHLHYKRSRHGGGELDRLMERTLARSGRGFRILPFSPDGYDERQYCSPGVDLDVGRLSRTPWGSYPEYHTSGDDLEFLAPESLAGTLELLASLVEGLERGVYYRNLSPMGEPQLGRRGLYAALGGHRDPDRREAAMQWLLNLSDGRHSLEDIAGASGFDVGFLSEVAGTLVEHELLVEEE